MKGFDEMEGTRRIYMKEKWIFEVDWRVTKGHEWWGIITYGDHERSKRRVKKWMVANGNEEKRRETNKNEGIWIKTKGRRIKTKGHEGSIFSPRRVVSGECISFELKSQFQFFKNKKDRLDLFLKK